MNLAHTEAGNDELLIGSVATNQKRKPRFEIQVHWVKEVHMRTDNKTGSK